jgi:hypothetical protein
MFAGMFKTPGEKNACGSPAGRRNDMDISHLRSPARLTCPRAQIQSDGSVCTKVAAQLELAEWLAQESARLTSPLAMIAF